MKEAGYIVSAVAHDVYKQMSWREIDFLYGNFENMDKVLIDVKRILDRKEIEKRL